MQAEKYGSERMQRNVDKNRCEDFFVIIVFAVISAVYLSTMSWVSVVERG